MYEYQTERPKLFTPDGVKLVLAIRDTAIDLHKTAGAFVNSALLRGCTGDSWTMLAAIDFLIEIGELQCISQKGATQHYVYKWTGRDYGNL